MHVLLLIDINAYICYIEHSVVMGVAVEGVMPWQASAKLLGRNGGAASGA